jgi:hypothetical protein
MNFNGIDEMNHISLFAKWKGIGSGRTADVKKHCGCGRKNSSKNLQCSKPFQLAMSAR